MKGQVRRKEHRNVRQEPESLFCIEAFIPFPLDCCFGGDNGSEPCEGVVVSSLDCIP